MLAPVQKRGKNSKYRKTKVNIKVTLRLTVIQSVCLSVLMSSLIATVFSLWSALSDERMGLVFCQSHCEL